MARAATTYTFSSPGRRIFGFMAVAMVFTLIGAEARVLSGQHTGAQAAGTVLGDPPSIFLGGTAATALLVAMADAGETGAKLGVGLAGVAVVAAVFVNGGTVWRALSNIMGTGPTGGLSAQGTPTAPAGAPTGAGQSAIATPGSRGTGVITL